jgi:dolichyl-phosphate-mannose-protein mannosyltransferase
MLFADRKTLPEWGFKQGEVTCTKSTENPRALLWNIELHVNPKSI